MESAASNLRAMATPTDHNLHDHDTTDESFMNIPICNLKDLFDDQPDVMETAVIARRNLIVMQPKRQTVQTAFRRKSSRLHNTKVTAQDGKKTDDDVGVKKHATGPELKGDNLEVPEI